MLVWLSHSLKTNHTLSKIPFKGRIMREDHFWKVSTSLSSPISFSQNPSSSNPNSICPHIIEHEKSLTRRNTKEKT